MASNYDKILKATVELMNANGYHGTSVKMIAEQVNISKSTIFHHFKSKEGILLALFEEAVPAATNEAMLIVNDKSLNGKEKLKKWLHFHLTQVATSGDILNVYLRESRFIGESSRAVYKESQRVYANLIVKIIRQVQKEDKQAFKNLDAKIVAHSILGMYNSAVIWFDPDGKISLEKLADMMYDIVSGSFQKPKTARKKKTAK
jgi:AcrR family transcriptional regulator